MPYRVEEVRFKIEPVRLTLAELGAVSAPGGLRKSALEGSLGVGGAEDSLDAGVTSKARLGRGRRMRGSSAIVYGRLQVHSFLSWVPTAGARDRVDRGAKGDPLKKIRASDCWVELRSRFVTMQFRYKEPRKKMKILRGQKRVEGGSLKCQSCGAAL
jgi:hypothetical protein